MMESKSLHEFKTMMGYDMFLKYSGMDFEKLAESTEDVSETFQSPYTEAPLFENVNTGIRFIDRVEAFTTLNESDFSWEAMSEDEKWALENTIWEGIAIYMNAEEGQINEGFWSGILSGIRDAGKKAVELAKATISGIGKVFQKIIKGFKGFVKTVCKKGIDVGGKAWAAMKAPAQERFARGRKHSAEQIEKESGELDSTVQWISGAGPDQLVGDGSAKAAGAVAASMGNDKEGEKEAKEKLAELEREAKQSGKQQQQQRPTPKQPTPKRESVEIEDNSLLPENMKHSTGFINQFRKEADESIMEELYDMVSAHVHESEIFVQMCEAETPGVVNEIFGLFKKKDKKLDKPENDAEKDVEKELADKDKEKIANASPAPDVGSPKSDADSETADKVEDAKESSWKGLLSKVKSIAFGGLAALMEQLLDWMFRGGFKAVSSVVKKFGGPGVFVFAIASAGLAILIGLVLEIIASFIIPSDAEGLSKAFADAMHMSGILPAAIYLIASAFKSMPAVKYTIKGVGVAIAVYMGWQHLKHLYTYEGHAGPAMDHKEAIKREEEAIKADEEDIDKTDNEELKKLLEERKKNNIKLSQLHEKMIPLEDEFKKLEEEDLPALQKEVKAAKKEMGKKVDSKDAEEYDALKSKYKDAVRMKEEAEKEDSEDAKARASALKDAAERHKEALDKVKARIKDNGGEEAQQKYEEANKKLHDLEHKIHEVGHKIKHKKEDVLGELLDKKKELSAKIKEMQKKNENRKYDINEASFKRFTDFINESVDDEMSVYPIKEIEAIRERKASVEKTIEDFKHRVGYYADIDWPVDKSMQNKQAV